MIGYPGFYRWRDAMRLMHRCHRSSAFGVLKNPPSRFGRTNEARPVDVLRTIGRRLLRTDRHRERDFHNPDQGQQLPFSSRFGLSKTTGREDYRRRTRVALMRWALKL